MTLSTFITTFAVTDSRRSAGKETHRGLGGAFTRSQVERCLPAGGAILGENAAGDISWGYAGQWTTVTRSAAGDVVVIRYYAEASYKRAVDGLRLYYGGSPE